MADVTVSPTGETSTYVLPLPPFWEAWLEEKLLTLNWKLIESTQAYRDGGTNATALKSVLKGLRRPAEPNGYFIEAALAGGPFEATYHAIDAELQLRGLRFFHAFYAIKEEAKAVVAAVATFREKNIPEPNQPFTYWGKDTAPAAQARKDWEAAELKVKQVIKSAPLPTYDTPRASAADVLAGIAKPDWDGDPPSVVEARKKAVAALHQLHLREATTGLLVSYGGDGHYVESGSTDEKVNRPVLKKALLSLPSTNNLKDDVEAELRKRGFDKARAKQLSEDYANIAIETFVRYFYREGLPNAMGTWDGTFTYGVGLNAFGGLGIELLNLIAAPPRSKVSRESVPALEQVQLYFQKCGIALLPGTALFNDVRVLHIEDGVGYVIRNSRTPSKPVKPAPPAATVENGRLVGPSAVEKVTFATRLAGYQVELAEFDWRKTQREAFLALEYLRHHLQLLKPFIAVGGVAKLPQALRPLADYAPIRALTEVSYIVFIENSGWQKMPLWYLLRGDRKEARGFVPGTAAFTFLHHISLWWGHGPGMLLAGMRWAIARGYVHARVKTRGDAAATEKLVELKSTSKALDKDKKPYGQAEDDDDEADADALEAILVDDSPETLVGFARAMFAYIEMNRHYSQHADTTLWFVGCKIWSDFIDDLIDESDSPLTLGPALPTVDVRAAYLDRESLGARSADGARTRKHELERLASPEAPQVRDEYAEKLRTSLHGKVPLLPLEPLADAIRRIKGELLEQFWYRYADEFASSARMESDERAILDGNFEDGALAVDPKPEDVTLERLSEKGRLRLSEDARDLAVQRYVILNISEASARATRNVVNHSHRQPFLDFKAGEYVLARRRDVEEMNVGVGTGWERAYSSGKLQRR